jgi:hypothetical protein
MPLLYFHNLENYTPCHSALIRILSNVSYGRVELDRLIDYVSYTGHGHLINLLDKKLFTLAKHNTIISL